MSSSKFLPLISPLILGLVVIFTGEFVTAEQGCSGFGWTLVDGACFKPYTYYVNNAQANELCQKVGAQLASFLDQVDSNLAELAAEEKRMLSMIAQPANTAGKKNGVMCKKASIPNAPALTSRDTLCPDEAPARSIQSSGDSSSGPSVQGGQNPRQGGVVSSGGVGAANNRDNNGDGRSSGSSSSNSKSDQSALSLSERNSLTINIYGNDEDEDEEGGYGGGGGRKRGSKQRKDKRRGGGHRSNSDSEFDEDNRSSSRSNRNDVRKSSNKSDFSKDTQIYEKDGSNGKGKGKKGPSAAAGGKIARGHFGTSDSNVNEEEDDSSKSAASKSAAAKSSSSSDYEMVDEQAAAVSSSAALKSSNANKMETSFASRNAKSAKSSSSASSSSSSSKSSKSSSSSSSKKYQEEEEVSED